MLQKAMVCFLLWPEVVTKMGPTPGLVPLVTSMQPAQSPLEAVCQHPSAGWVGGKLPTICEIIQIISNELNFPCQLFC